MKTYEQIYVELQDKPNDSRFTLLECLNIFENEGSWVGSGFQMMKAMELVSEITGIRPGSCSGCRIDALQNMVRWKNNYEKTLVIVEAPKKVKSKQV
jgi:hypothetical protein